MNRPEASSKRRRHFPDSSGILLFSAGNGSMVCYNCSQFQSVKDEFRYRWSSGIFGTEQRNFLTEQGNFAGEQRNLGAWDSVAETGRAPALGRVTGLCALNESAP
jgi:hypothetical protein